MTQNETQPSEDNATPKNTRRADENRLRAALSSGKDRTAASAVIRHAESERIAKDTTDRLGQLLLSRGIRLERLKFGLHPSGPRHGTFQLHFGSESDATRVRTLIERGRFDSGSATRPAPTGSQEEPHDCEPMPVEDVRTVVQFSEDDLDRVARTIQSVTTVPEK